MTPSKHNSKTAQKAVAKDIQVIVNGNAKELLQPKKVTVHIPKKEEHTSTFLFHDSSNAIPAIKGAINNNTPTLLVGETGTGKTTLLRELAKQEGKTLIRVSVNGSTSTEEVVGKWLLKDGETVWIDGVLTTAMRKGQWIVFDEINAALPEVLFSLHSVLDDERKLLIAERDGEIVLPHNDFRFFATMNPCSHYAGTKEMNSALMSRFGVVLHIPTLKEHEEKELLIQRIPTLPHAYAETLVQTAHKLRVAWKDEDIRYYCSTRDLLSTASMVEHFGGDLPRAFVVASLNKAETEEEREHIQEIIKGVMVIPKSTAELTEAFSQEEAKGKIIALSKALYEMQKTGEIAILATKLLDAMVIESRKESDIMRSIINEYIKPFLESLAASCNEKAKDDELSESSREKYKNLYEELEKHLDNINSKMKQADEQREKIEPQTSKLIKQYEIDKKEIQDRVQREIDELNKSGKCVLIKDTEKPKADGSKDIDYELTLA